MRKCIKLPLTSRDVPNEVSKAKARIEGTFIWHYHSSIPEYLQDLL